ncbi:MAG TPA: hypothetical protein VM659_19625, partial [Dongiaceae bacterium]|nr:hypothetical protein [Dongiaceae bacterium]
MLKARIVSPPENGPPASIVDATDRWEASAREPAASENAAFKQISSTADVGPMHEAEAGTPSSGAGKVGAPDTGMWDTGDSTTDGLVTSGTHQGAVSDATMTMAALAAPSMDALVAPLAAAVSPFAVVTPQVVQIIDTTKWANPSPDPAGLAWIPGAGAGTLYMSDSEIDETPFFRPDNLFVMTPPGVFNHSTSLQSFTIEPTGLAYDPLNGHLFISDDDKHGIFEVDAANPGTKLNFFSTKTYAPDCEDVAWDPVTNHLLIIEGSTGNVNAHTLFETTTSGTLVKSTVLPSTISDPEAVVYDSARQVFYISGGFSPDIFVVSRDGLTILDTIKILESYRNPINGTSVHPKGLTLAPSSNPNDDPSTMSLWVADYGRDQVMDGRLFEIQLGPVPTQPPLFTANADTVDFNKVTAGSYLAGSQYDALGGNDVVTLALDATAATNAGFDPA